MTECIIDFCIEEDGFVNLDSPDLDHDDLKILRNQIELYLIREDVPRNVWGEIRLLDDGELCVDYRPCTDDE